MLHLKRRNRLDDAGFPFDNGIDRLFDALSCGWALPAASGGAADFLPPFDVSETDAEYQVRVELPGVAPSDVEVTVTGDVLTIRGEKKCETSSDAGNVRHTERVYGRFERSMQFSVPVDAGRIEAVAKDGVLMIRAPKAEESRPKTIAVKVA